MLDNTAIILRLIFLDHLSVLGFMLVALPLLGLVGFDMRRAAKSAQKQNSSSMQFLSRYRDENGMPIFFEAGEDPSARAAHRVLAQMRRADSANDKSHERTQ